MYMPYVMHIVYVHHVHEKATYTHVCIVQCIVMYIVYMYKHMYMYMYMYMFVYKQCVMLYLFTFT